MIAITRDDRSPEQQGRAGPFYRIEARDGCVKLRGREVEAQLPATTYEPGVLFLKVTLFRRLLSTFRGEKMITIQAHAQGLVFGNVEMPFEPNDMLLYLDPDQAPHRHPDDVICEGSNATTGPAQGWLFEP